MLKKLNEALQQVRLRLLSLEQLQQRVAEALEEAEPDADDLNALSDEVQCRLAATQNAAERAELQALATRVVRHKLARDIEQGAPIEPDLMTEPPRPMPRAEAKEILALILSFSSTSRSELEKIGGKRVARAFRVLDEVEISKAVATLVEVLRSERRWGQDAVMAAGVLGHIGPAAKSAVPALVQVIESSKYSTKWAATWALGQMGEAAAEAIPALIQILPGEDDAPRSTKCAALALGMMGTQAAAAIPAMEKACADRNVGGTVKLALACVKGEQPISVLNRGMSEEDPLGKMQRLEARISEAQLSRKCMCSVPG